LHAGDPFVIPNPWDAGSARALAKLGFKALASTSGGFAQTLGGSDGQVSLDEVVDHARALARATDLPVSMDLEHGYGPEPADAARAITSVAAAGAGWRLDRGLGSQWVHLRHRPRGGARGRRARCGPGAGFPVHVHRTGREHFRNNPDLEDTFGAFKRMRPAEADVLYAPWLRTDDEIRTVCATVSKPVNVLAFPDMSMDRIAAAGAQRVRSSGDEDAKRIGRFKPH
jgi:2-methylisocitrate lyase-like PEP mutase family enzyme